MKNDLDFANIQNLNIDKFILKNEFESESPKYDLSPELDEAYDAVIIFTKSKIDFSHLESVLKLQRKQEYMNSHIGTCRVLPYDDFMKLWESR